MDLTNKEATISSFMKELYSNGGTLSLSKFARFLDLDVKRALNWLTDHSSYFKIVPGEDVGDERSVLGITEATFCPKHGSKPGSCLWCSSLHVCKFFALGSSCKFGVDCNFCHNFGTDHNQRVLRKYYLIQLNELELKCLFQQIENRCDLTIPKICKYFNNGSCNKNDCICLHICRFYIMNECAYGKFCKVNHDFDVRNINILKMYGITFSSISDAVSKIRIMYNVQQQKADSSDGEKRADKSTTKKKDLICLHHLSTNGCAFKSTCRYHHKEFPYQWRYHPLNLLGDYCTTDTKWVDFNPSWNEKIEKKFCDLKYETILTSNQSQAHFQFNEMKCSMAKQEFRLQRLSTVSSKTDTRSSLATTWIWYWKDNGNIWVEYASSSSSHSINITNDDIEKSFLENPDGKMILKLENGNRLEVDFHKMVQRGKSQRKVIRRPKFITKENINILRTKPLKTMNKSKSIDTQPNNLPVEWNVPDHITKGSSYFNISELDGSSQEYKTVSCQFFDSMSSAEINKIERIENGNLWENYQWKKMKMAKRMSDQIGLNEMNLFHGTDHEIIDAICKQGFDVRLSGSRVGSKYGKGIYFSRDSAFANIYANPENVESKLLLAKVLTGDFIQGKPNYLRPPQKNSDEKGGELYDSCVDDISNPKLFVIFSNEQAYPAYIITYSLTE